MLACNLSLTLCSVCPQCIFYTALPASEFFFITTLHGPLRKHSLYCKGGVFTDPLPSNGHPTVARVGSRGNVFTKLLPSNVCIPHNTKFSSENLVWFKISTNEGFL
jgi:hypothetical protein